MRASADAGARFVVSPGLVPEVVEAALELGIEPMPGVFTPTELIQAIAAGAPRGEGLPRLRRRAGIRPGFCAARFPHVPLVPTGGVKIDEIPAYLDAGASAVALGSELVGRAAPTSDDELAWIAAQATRAVAVTTRSQ